MIAHDIRTPLNALMLSVRAAKILLTKPDEAKASLEIAERNVVALSHIIDSLLDMTDSGQGKLEFCECMPVDLITSAIDQIVPQALLKNLNIESEKDIALPPLVADATRLVRVLVNLLSNAVRFSPKGSKIHVSAKTRSNDGHESVVFTVTDEGTGVPAESYDKIFQSGVSMGKGGKYSSGLGLAVCRELVEAHGGRIWIDTTATKGATFSFSIPLPTELSTRRKEN